MQHWIYLRNPSKQTTDDGDELHIKLLLKMLFRVVCGKTFFTVSRERKVSIPPVDLTSQSTVTTSLLDEGQGESLFCESNPSFQLLLLEVP